jgi:hypothetical protein
MALDQTILNEVRTLEAYFRVGLDGATGLRKKLEGIHPSASPIGALSDDRKAQLIARAEKSRTKKSLK